MGHGLTSKDRMAFAGLTPWHFAETGQDGRAIDVGDKALSAVDMFERVKLLWTVSKAPAEVIHEGKIIRIPNQFGLVRSDTFDAFPATVGRVFKPYQNREMAEFADTLRKVGDGQLFCHTAGSLDAGARVWALMRVGGEVIVERNGQADKELPYLLLRNAHDGSSTLRIAEVVERVVCANTERVALDGALTDISIRHTGSLQDKLADAARVLGYAEKRFAAFADFLQGLADTAMERREFKLFVCDLLTQSESGAGVEKVKEMQAEAKENATARRQLEALTHSGEMLVDLFERGAGNAGKTRLDARNAVTDWVDHRQGNLARWRKKAGQLGMLQHRLDSSLFGDGAKVKARAGALLRVR